MDSQCLVCRDIEEFVKQIIQYWSVSLKRDGRENRTLGPYRNRMNCTACQEVFQSIQLYSQQVNATLLQPECSLEILLFSDRYPQIQIGGKRDCHDGKHVKLGLVASRTSGFGKQHFKVLDPKFIDLETVQKWPKYCDSHHEGTCHSFPDKNQFELPTSLMLIDVDNGCLVKIPNPDQYTCLSYVWGKRENNLLDHSKMDVANRPKHSFWSRFKRTPRGQSSSAALRQPGNVPHDQSSSDQSSIILEARKENLAMLLEPGSLSGKSAPVPATIRDAISLTKAMSIPYLWVDRFCIVQDDPVHLKDNISRMASIYARSYFTIIATDGNNSQSGLRGIGHGSNPRSYSQKTLRIGPLEAIVHPSQVEEVKDWHTRGWTFQERAVSRRSLVFNHGTVKWECQKCLWFENINAEPDGVSADSGLFEPHSGFPRYNVRMVPWPDLNQYCNLVQGYNNRELTCETDAQDAFTAILDIYGSSFPSEIFFGIPELCFDICLLWQHYDILKRRKDFPSWSWLGWQGNIQTPHSKLWNANLYETADPVAEWSKKCAKTEKMLRIDNSFYSWKSKQCQLNPPEGWRRGENRSGQNMYWYGEKAFFHPMPIQNSARKKEPGNWEQFLYCKTKSCKLTLADSFIPKRIGEVRADKDNLSLFINLRDSKGLWAGVIQTNFSSEKDYVQGEEGQFIAVSLHSMGVIAHRFKSLEWKPPELDLGHIRGSYEFYNVLWIYWDEGIAYRKGVGRVWNKAWSLLEVSDVNVKIG